MSFTIGIDFGGVLSIHDSKIAADTEHKNTSVNMPNAIETLQKLKELGHKLVLISFCGKSRAKETSEQLARDGYDKLFEKQYYVKNKEYKSDVCLTIGCHFMIDDNIEVLNNIKRNNKYIKTILFDSINNYKHISALNWNQTFKIITDTKEFDIQIETCDLSSKLYLQ